MKKLIVSAVIVASVLGIASCSKRVTQSPGSISLVTRMDSVAYAYGVANGNGFKQSLDRLPGDSLSRPLISEGFRASFGKGGALMTAEEARLYFQSYVKELKDKEDAILRSKNDSVLLINKAREGVTTTESGLQYRVLRSANGPKPQPTDTVVVHYVGRTIDGKQFDSSYDRREPTTFELGQVIKGWTEGVGLMSKGAKYEFYIPYTLAYGERGIGDVIPPFATLIFEVELLDIKGSNATVEENVPAVEPKKTTPRRSKRRMPR